MVRSSCPDRLFAGSFRQCLCQQSDVSRSPPSHKDDQMVIEEFSTSLLRSLVSGFLWEVTGTYSFAFVNILVPL